MQAQFYIFLSPFSVSVSIFLVNTYFLSSQFVSCTRYLHQGRRLRRLSLCALLFLNLPLNTPLAFASTATDGFLSLFPAKEKLNFFLLPRVSPTRPRNRKQLFFQVFHLLGSAAAPELNSKLLSWKFPLHFK